MWTTVAAAGPAGCWQVQGKVTVINTCPQHRFATPPPQTSACSILPDSLSPPGPLMSRSLQTLKHREGSAGLRGSPLAQRQSSGKQTCSQAPTKDVCG